MANIDPRKNKKGEITSYRIRVFKGRDLNGKLLPPYILNWKVPTGKNWSEEKIQKELNKVATLFEQECKEGIAIAENKSPTFMQYADYVINLKQNVENKKHRTIKRYKELLVRINAGIGHIRLCDLKPQHLNAFYEQLSQDGMNLKTGGKLSVKTILEYHRLIHTILAQADKEMLVKYNAGDKATPPKQQKKQANFIEDDDLLNILYWVENEPLKWQVCINLLAYTGGRRGEVAGLKLDKINIKKNLIHFSEALLYASDIGVYTDTLKTEASDRILEIPDKPMTLIKRLIQELKRNKEILGTAWTDSGYLLTQDNGKPMHPDSITDYCAKFRAKYNKIIEEKNKELPPKEQFKLIPPMNPHAFRHSQASILIFHGADVVSVSQRLGHSSPVVTGNIYAHFLKKANKKMADINAQVLG